MEMHDVELNAHDAIDQALLRIIQINRAKRADYASASNAFANFEKVAAALNLEGYDRKEDCMAMVIRKIARINNLRGREPSNEAVLDSYLDLATYAMLLYAMALEDAGEVPAFVAPAYEGDDK